MSRDPAWEPWAGLTLREVEFAHHGCPAGRVVGVASVPQAEHREDGGIVLADGFRQPICYGVEVARARGAPKESGWRDKQLLKLQRSDYGEIGVVADLFGLPEVAAVVFGHVRQAGAQGHFDPLQGPQRSLGSGQVEAVRFLNE